MRLGQIGEDVLHLAMRLLEPLDLLEIRRRQADPARRLLASAGRRGAARLRDDLALGADVEPDGE